MFGPMGTQTEPQSHPGWKDQEESTQSNIKDPGAGSHREEIRKKERDEILELDISGNESGVKKPGG